MGQLTWGPYLSDRQWGTVREDYSADGNAWNYTTHDQARSKAWRWGEEGIGGISDDRQLLCFAPAFWNGRDPILKERLYGLSNSEGNHGEDVKELYYYLDNTPSHSYMKMLYKYPHAEFPYSHLHEENQRRSRLDPEFEVLQTGVFENNAYFDIYIEYAKAKDTDLLIRITAFNRGADRAHLTVLPTAWFRNIWTFGLLEGEKPHMTMAAGALKMTHPQLGAYFLYAADNPQWLFCENETNNQRLYRAPNHSPSCKDGINDRIVGNNSAAVNQDASGTKAAAWYQSEIDGGGQVVLKLRLTQTEKSKPFSDFDAVFTKKQAEADAFYHKLQHSIQSPDDRLIQRQAYAGMLWSKQFYYYYVPTWLEGDPGEPPPPAERLDGRNSDWQNFESQCILSMPDKWEYPWFAAWDLAFHCIPLARLDANFAKSQLEILFSDQFRRREGQLPAYEWNFSDVNPPVQAWAVWKVFDIERQAGKTDLDFLRRMFTSLAANYTWWITQKDSDGNDLFSGGFLGLDNIGVFDRSQALPSGDRLEQADATAWMAFYSMYMIRIALELGRKDAAYQDVAMQYFDHFLQIAAAIGSTGGDRDLWDDTDGFFYDMLRFPDGSSEPLKVRSAVGLIPLFAVLTLSDADLAATPVFKQKAEAFLTDHPDLAAMVSRWHDTVGDTRLLSLLRGHRTKGLLQRMLDETEFLSDYGVRSLSKYHLDHPFEMDWYGNHLSVSYLPAESDSGMFGGNSNWRGPIWMPVNYLLVESLREFHRYYGADFKVECPVGSGRMLSLSEVADELARRLCSIFQRKNDGRRPVFGSDDHYQQEPAFQDLLLFYEYFDGDDGHGVGAAHQTGWTGLVAELLSKP
jgi:hypothetical protein